jgi:pantetheine-phosphate adenylyltransferase
MRVAVYPGSFDPVTFGHLDVARRAAAVFDRVVFAVLTNPRKQSLLTVAERLEAIRASVAVTDPSLADRLDAQSFDGLTVDVCRRAGASFIVRGLRAISDFETEMQLAHNNRVLAPGIDTVFFMTSVEHGYVSSTLVREIAGFGGDVRAMVPGPAEVALRVAVERVR